MNYMGSKNKVAKYIVPIIEQKIVENKVNTYVEPFVGGANIIDKVNCDTKVGCDNQKYLIALLQNLDKIGLLPDEVSKEHYDDVREAYKTKSEKYPDWYVEAIGFLASYNGRFFDGGYSGIRVTKGGIRNYYDESKRNLEAQVSDLRAVDFMLGDYKTTSSSYENAVIYCDPPYQNTKKYKSSQEFDYQEFWDWCRKMSEKNIVLVSEHSAPDDFQCIWEKPVKRSIGRKANKATEKLFEIKPHREIVS